MVISGVAINRPELEKAAAARFSTPKLSSSMDRVMDVGAMIRSHVVKLPVMGENP